MPASPTPRPGQPTDRETAKAVVSKWMAGQELTPAEEALLLRLRAVNMAQQLASTVRA
ncbi:hypothetical protein NKL07_22040 [Mesorhizobium sp. C280B]|uniref:hypothetical protein n=1 Tax=unclassified Mesorhizobium TaxID=325217 RepID=UPI0003FA9C5C|nr:hypothetical protein [Mesorhizobium sp. LSJC280B00]